MACVRKLRKSCLSWLSGSGKLALDVDSAALPATARRAATSRLPRDCSPQSHTPTWRTQRSCGRECYPCRFPITSSLHRRAVSHAPKQPALYSVTKRHAPLLEKHQITRHTLVDTLQRLDMIA